MAQRRKKSCSSRIAAAAAAILDEHAIDHTQPVIIEPLARELRACVRCARETARRHIAHQIRLRRGEMSVIGAHGGARRGAGRPKMDVIQKIAEDLRQIGWREIKFISVHTKTMRIEAHGKNKDNEMFLIRAIISIANDGTYHFESVRFKAD